MNEEERMLEVVARSWKYLAERVLMGDIDLLSMSAYSEASREYGQCRVGNDQYHGWQQRIVVALQ